MEHPSSVGTPYGYTDMVFSGNTYDVNNTSGTAITINKSGTSNPSTYDTGQTSVTFTGSVPITVTVVNAAGTAITTAAVRIEEADGTLVAQGDVNGSGVYSTTYGGSTPLAVTIKVRSSSSGETRYFPVRTSGTIASSTGLVTTVSMTADDIAA